MTMTFTILGCGSSGGVPRPALGWGVCDPSNPKNRRRRTSLQRTPIVVDSRNRMSASRSAASGGASAVSTVPGRVRFMRTGVRYTSSAPAARRRSTSGS